MRKRQARTTSFPALVQRFFTQYLVEQRALSPRTVAAYRDTSCCFWPSPRNVWLSRRQA